MVVNSGARSFGLSQGVIYFDRSVCIFADTLPQLLHGLGLGLPPLQTLQAHHATGAAPSRREPSLSKNLKETRITTFPMSFCPSHVRAVLIQNAPRTRKWKSEATSQYA